ncbi:hypothetical protein Lal_00045262 [Lupinus albus]|nr:hypothetical protein Lal_00045262 [Lupinus albus]
MTCNPNWAEIIRFVKLMSLKPHDRLDIISRVFKMKFEELLQDLKKIHVMGKVLAYPCNKYPTPDDIDRIFYVEIPNQNDALNYATWVEQLIQNSKFLTFENSICNVYLGSELVDLLKQAKQIIWDEAPMKHKFCFEALDKSLADRMGTTSNDSILFGGIVVVFGGDFTQILPVVPRGCLSSTYPNLQRYYKDEEYLQSKAILALTTEIVDQINDYVLSIIPGLQISRFVNSRDHSRSGETTLAQARPLSLRRDHSRSGETTLAQSRPLSLKRESFSIAQDFTLPVNILTPEFLNTLSTYGVPIHKINLKVGTPIMLLKNLDQAE